MLDDQSARSLQAFEFREGSEVSKAVSSRESFSGLKGHEQAFFKCCTGSWEVMQLGEAARKTEKRSRLGEKR